MKLPEKADVFSKESHTQSVLASYRVIARARRRVPFLDEIQEHIEKNGRILRVFQIQQTLNAVNSRRKKPLQYLSENILIEVYKKARPLLSPPRAPTYVEIHQELLKLGYSLSVECLKDHYKRFNNKRRRQKRKILLFKSLLHERDFISAYVRVKKELRKNGIRRPPTYEEVAQYLANRDTPIKYEYLRSRFEKVNKKRKKGDKIIFFLI